jgi:hypothetical protein
MLDNIYNSGLMEQEGSWVSASALFYLVFGTPAALKFQRGNQLILTSATPVL